MKSWIKQYKTSTFPDAKKNSNVKNGPISCSLSKTEPLTLNRTGASGQRRNPGCVCAEGREVGGGGSLQSCSHLLCAGARQPLQRKSLWAHETWCHQISDWRMRSSGPALWCWQAFGWLLERGLLYGQGPKMGIKFRPPSQVVIPSEATSLTSFSFLTLIINSFL